MIAAICMPPSTISHDDTGVQERSRIQRLAFLVPMLFILIGFSTALVCILYEPERKVSKSRAQDSTNALDHVVRRLTDQTPPSPTVSPHLLMLPAHVTLRLIYFLFLNPLIAFTVQLLLALLSATLVLTQKFARPREQGQYCGLQDEGENVWGFGQTLSLGMLLLPLLSAWNTYLEGRQDIHEA